MKARWLAGEDNGFALLVVLWTMVMLSFLAFAIIATGRRQVRMAALERLHAQLQAQADGGVWEAAFHLLDPARGHWSADGVIHQVRHDRIVIQYRIVSEGGKVNPNLASPDLLAALLRVVGAQDRIAQTVAANIRAWRFPLQQGATPPAGSAAAYVAAGLTYGPPGAPFQTPEETGLVLGMTPGLTRQLLPYLSLYWDADPILSLASPVVRQALVMTGRNPAPDDEARAQTIVGIDVTVTDTSGARALRHAVITAQPGGNAAFPVRIVQWDMPQNY